MQELETSIVIGAPPLEVWRVLMNFADYPRWNPFITRIQGVPQVDEKIKVKLRLSTGLGMALRPTVFMCDPPHEFRWRGSLLFPGIFDGEHKFEIQDNRDGSVTFVHGEKFSGILVPVLLPILERTTRTAFEKMNQELKKQCERGVLH